MQLFVAIISKEAKTLLTTVEDWGMTLLVDTKEHQVKRPFGFKNPNTKKF